MKTQEAGSRTAAFVVIRTNIYFIVIAINIIKVLWRVPPGDSSAGVKRQK